MHYSNLTSSCILFRYASSRLMISCTRIRILQNRAFGLNILGKVGFVFAFHDSLELCEKFGIRVGSMLSALKGDHSLGVFANGRVGLCQTYFFTLAYDGFPSFCGMNSNKLFGKFILRIQRMLMISDFFLLSLIFSIFFYLNN